jgi:hypothetical protein
MVVSTFILNTYKELTLRGQVLNSDVFTEHLGFLVFWITHQRWNVPAKAERLVSG